MPTYSQTIRHLYSLTRHGIKLGLDNTRRLAELAGNPQQDLRFIHVAGTNGKGSTCAMLESIYRNSGLRIGLFTSPHLVSFRERIQVNRQPVPEADVVRLTSELRELAARVDDLIPTFFEFLTVMALRHFAAEQCELVILETGMGGRFDSTNIVDPLASVITPVDLDHQQFLGDTLTAIAGEKAGIIKPGRPVFSAPQANAAREVLIAKARETGSRLAFTSTGALRLAAGALPGFSAPHTVQNAALAAEVANGLITDLPVTPQQVAHGITTTKWPGRMQTLEHQGRQVLIDGAHNEAGFRALTTAIGDGAFSKRPALIMGMLADKDPGEIPDLIAGTFSHVHLTDIAGERGGGVDSLAERIRDRHPDFPCHVQDSLPAALAATGDSDCVIAGSMYLVGEALELLEAVPPGVASERHLNDWSARDNS